MGDLVYVVDAAMSAVSPDRFIFGLLAHVVTVFYRDISPNTGSHSLGGIRG